MFFIDYVKMNLMRFKKILLILTLLASVFLCFFAATAVFAEEGASGVQLAPEKDPECATILKAFCNSSGNDIIEILKFVIGIFTVGIVVLATIGIIWCGFIIMTARDDASQVTKAKKRLFEIVIGIVIWAISSGLLAMLLPTFTGTIEEPDVGAPDMPGSADERSYKEKEQESRKYTSSNPANDNSKKSSQNGGSNSNNKSGSNDSGAAKNTPNVPDKVTITVKDTGAYRAVETSAGAIPYVYTPNGGYAQNPSTVASKLKKKKVLVIANAGTFNMGTGRASGIVIAKGKRVQDHKKSECQALVIDRYGQNPGWVSAASNAKSLIAGKTQYNDMYGKKVKGAVYSASSCYGPLVVGGKISYKYAKIKDHYVNRRARSIFCAKKSGNSIKYAIISNRNEGSGGGWDFSRMAKAAKNYGCTFAYNFDGGGSTVLYTRKKTSSSFSHYGGSRSVPTYIIFTADNKPI